MTHQTTPTLDEELTRKLTDFLSNRLVRIHTNDVDPGVVGIEAGALWDVLAGLVDEQLLQVLTELEKSRLRPGTKRYFVNLTRPCSIVIAFDPAKPGWVMAMKTPTSKLLQHSTTDTGPVREQAIAAVVQKLAAQQFQEIT